MVNLHNEYYLITKKGKKKLLVDAATWVDLWVMMLSEKSQGQNVTYHVIP